MKFLCGALVLLAAFLQPLEAQSVESWHLAPEPVFRLNSEGMPEGFDLYRIRAGTVLPDGRVVVAQNGGVILLSPAGDSASHLGREGDGPGEFQSPRAVAYLGDPEILRIYDYRHHRITSIPLDSSEVSTEPVRTGNNVALLGDGSLVAFERQRWGSQEEFLRGERVPGPYVEAVHLVRYFDGHDQVVAELEEGVKVQATFHHMIMSAPAPLGRELVWGAGGGFIVWGYNDTGTLTVLGRDGEVQDTIRTLNPPTRIEPRDRRYAEERFLEEGSPPLLPALEHDWTDHLRYILSEAPKPETMPLIDAVEVSREGLVWVRQFDLRDSATGTWEVHSPGEGCIATIDLPSGLTVLEVGRDHVLGVERDALDVEYLVKYAIVR